jgi:hypothetical protein
LVSNVFELVLRILVKFFGYLLPFTLRWWYSPQRLADGLNIFISSESDGVEFWAGDLPYVQVWIVITNQTPFALELDRCFGSFGFGLPVCEFAHLERRCIAANGKLSFMLRTNMTAFQLEYVRKMRGQFDKVSLDFQGQFLCSVSTFNFQRRISTTHFRLRNFG